MSAILAHDLQAALIDSFTSGSIANTAAPPFQNFEQFSLPGVIGNGNRTVTWLATTGPESAELDLNVLVPGNVVLHSGAGTTASWVFDYQFPALDLTVAGQANGIAVKFASADAGNLHVFAADTSFGSSKNVLFSAMPTGGTVYVPFSAIPSVDFTQATYIQIAIQGVAGGAYQLEMFNAQLVPEPSSLGLGAFGLASLTIYGWRRRIRYR